MKLLLAIALLSVPAWANSCVSASSGNWRSATWNTCGSTYPQSGDTFTVSTGNNVTIPGAESDTVTSGTVSGTGTLTINGTLISGSITHATDLTLVAGSTLSLSNGAVVKSTSGAKLVVNGTSGSRVTIGTVTGTATIGGTGSSEGSVSATYVDLTNVSFANNLSSSSDVFNVAHFTITNGIINNTAVDPAATWSLAYGSFISPPSPLSTITLTFCGSGCSAKTSGTRVIQHIHSNDGQIDIKGGNLDIGLVFDDVSWYVPSNSSSGYAPLGIISYTGIPSFSGSNWGGTSGNLFWMDRASGFNSQYNYLPAGTLKNGYILLTNRNCAADQVTLGGQVNNNINSIITPTSTVLQDWTADMQCSYGSLFIDGVTVGTAPWTARVTGTVILPQALGGGALGDGKGVGLYIKTGTPCAQSGSNYCSTATVDHNTYVGNLEGNFGGISSYEQTLFSGAYTAVQDNIIWQGGSTTGTVIVGSATPVNGTFTTVDHNWTYNLTNNVAGGGGAYQNYGTAKYSAGPTESGSGSPTFAAATRNTIAWCYSKGSANTGNIYNDLDTCFAKFAFETGTYDASYTISDLRSWTRAGFVPGNSSVGTASSTGSYVGAIPLAGASTVTISGATIKGASIQ